MNTVDTSRTFFYNIRRVAYSATIAQQNAMFSIVPDNRGRDYCCCFSRSHGNNTAGACGIK